MNNLSPLDWNVGKIGEHARITTGNKDTQDKVNNAKYPFFVRSQNVERINSYSFDGEGVLTAGDGVGTGKVFHYINGKFDYHQRVYLISNFDEKLDGRFFYEYFSKYFIERVKTLSAKGSVDSVRMEMISGMEIPLPPLPEQQNIASILTSVDQVIERTEAQIDKLQDLKKGMMQELLTKGIGHTEFKDSPVGRIPKVWATSSISNAGIKVIDGDRGKEYPKERDFLDWGYCLFLSAKNVTKDGFRFDECSFISKQKDGKLRKGRLARGDIVITTRGTVGNIAYYDTTIPFDGVRINSGMAVLRNENPGIVTNFLYDLLQSPVIRNQIKVMTFGSAQPQLTIGLINEFNIPIPRKDEQERISDVLSSINRKITKKVVKLRETHYLKNALMQDLLTGKVRVKVN